MDNGIYLQRRLGQLILIHHHDAHMVNVIVDSGDAIAGTIYAGRIERCDPHQYWVDIGFEKPALLQRSKHTYTQGQRVCVQLRRPPLQDGTLTKNAEVADAITLMGSSLSYLPGKQGVNFSASLKDKEWKQQIQGTFDGALNPHEGLFIRGRAYGQSTDDLLGDLQQLRTLYTSIQDQSAAKPPVGTALYLPARPAVNYCLDQRKVPVFTNDAEAVVHLKAAGLDAERFHFSPAPTWLGDFDHLIQAVLDPLCPLESGGYLLIEEGQTLTAIDVNTTSPGESRLTSAASLKSDTDRLAFAQGALNEAIHQLYVRKIGGIILIDLPRLSNTKHQRALEITAKSYEDPHLQILGFTKSGLLEITKRKEEPSLKVLLGS